jgi:cytochrome c-type biogenesis protein CcsB
VAIEVTLSHLSDLAFEGAVAGYFTAVVCHAVDFAGRRTPAGRRTTTAAAETSSVARLLGASGSASTSAAADGRGPVTGTALLTRDATAPTSPRALADTPVDVPPSPRRGTPMGERFGLAAVVVTALGFALHLVALVTRGFAVHRVPWGNMYEFTLMITAGAVAGWLVVLWRTRLRSIGVFVMTPITVLVFLAGTVLYTTAGPIAPALHSYWLVIHVAAISLSSGVLMISGIASVIYLLRDRYERRLAAGKAEPDAALSRLPPLATVDRIAYRTAIAAFPVYTFAIIAGAMWAEVSWGSYWSWDPKETVALVSWILFAGYLHARATAGWRGRWAAWISVVGLVSIMFNLFFVNMVVSGLHSYAGLN